MSLDQGAHPELGDAIGLRGHLDCRPAKVIILGRDLKAADRPDEFLERRCTLAGGRHRLERGAERRRQGSGAHVSPAVSQVPRQSRHRGIPSAGVRKGFASESPLEEPPPLPRAVKQLLGGRRVGAHPVGDLSVGNGGPLWCLGQLVKMDEGCKPLVGAPGQMRARRSDDLPSRPAHVHPPQETHGGFRRSQGVVGQVEVRPPAPSPNKRRRGGQRREHIEQVS